MPVFLHSPPTPPLHCHLLPPLPFTAISSRPSPSLPSPPAPPLHCHLLPPLPFTAISYCPSPSLPSAPTPPLQTVEILLRDTTVLPEEDSSSMSPFDKEPPPSSPSQLSSKDSPQGELQFPPGFQLDLTCTVMHLDAAHAVPSPAPINSVEYSSKFGL